MTKKAATKVRFQRHVEIGAADARDDAQFLEDCFIDTGAINVLQDTSSPKCIVLGRTGSGKTALLEQLRIRKKRVIPIEPECLSLSYIENSTIIRFFIDLRVNMDPFYRLLWRHVFVVEIIRNHYNIINKQTNDNSITRLRERIRKDRAKEEALEYFFKYGDHFWEETTTRIKTLTNTMEQDLSKSVLGKAGGTIPGGLTTEIGVSREVAKSLTEEERSEVHDLGQRVVQTVQLQKLNTMMQLLEEDILDDAQKKYYITIDRLDEGWVDDTLRYQLIRSLLETAHDFNSKVSNVKIIVAIREDLLDRVFRHTRSPGYQEEKYRSMYIPLNWDEKQLEELVLRRAEKLLRPQISDDEGELQIEDIIPTLLHVRKRTVRTLQYIFERTLLRPRDVISFFNECIKKVDLNGKITQSIIFSAEEIYSDVRLRALSDEWSADYLTLYEAALLFRHYPANFKVAYAHGKSFDDSLLDYLAMNSQTSACAIYQMIFERFYKAEDYDLDSIILELMKILFKVGIIGVGVSSKRERWSYLGDKFPTSDKLSEMTFSIHPAFWRVLAVSN